MSSQLLAAPRRCSSSLQRRKLINSGAPLLTFTFGDLRDPLFTTEDGILFADPLLCGIDPVHVIETPGVAILSSCLRLGKEFLDISTLESLVRRVHGKVHIDFKSKLVVCRTDVRSVRELYNARQWSEFNLAEEPRMASQGIIPVFSARKQSERKRPRNNADPKEWNLTELKRRCLEAGVVAL